MIRRIVAHTSARDAFDKLAVTNRETGQQHLRWMPGQPVCHPDPLEFSMLFCHLLDSREHADYNHLRSHSKTDARAAIMRAERAVQLLRSARSHAPDQVRAVCIAAIAAPNTRSRITAQ